ncbi:MAG: VanW family protein [Bacillota bacterium]
MERYSGRKNGAGGTPGVRRVGGTANTNDAGANRKGGQPAPKRKQKASGRTRFLRGTVILLVLLLACVVIVLLTGGGEGNLLDAVLPAPRFDQGVTVAGVDVGGMTMEQAQPKVQSAADAVVADAAFKLVYDEQMYTLSASQLGITADVESALKNALEYSKEEHKDIEQPGFYPSYSAVNENIVSALEGIAQKVDTEPVEPYATPNTDIEAEEFFTYAEGQDGVKLDVAAAAAAIAESVQKGDLDATVLLTTTFVAPTLTVTDIQSNITLISKFTTKFRNSSSDQIIKNRVFNIRKAAGIINGCKVETGAEWSFNGFVGLRTLDAGWKEANGISGGKEYTLQAGGGICQVSTTLYNALLCGNVNVTDRRKHSIPSDYVDKGLDATVDSSGIDLKFLNDTGQPLYLFVRITKNEESSRYLDITVYVYGKPLPEGVTYKTRSVEIEIIPHEEVKYTADATTPLGFQRVIIIRRDGFVAEAYLDKYQDGKLAESKLMYTDRYSGNIAEIGVGTGDPARTSIPEGATAIGSTVVDELGNILYVDMAAVNALLAQVE